MWDTCNQYVATGEAAGLIPFALLLATIVYGFKFLGRARNTPGTNQKQALFLWSLSVGIFANVVAYFGISYFDQTVVAWYALLAIGITMAAVQRKQAALPKSSTVLGVGEPGTVTLDMDVAVVAQAPSSFQPSERSVHADRFSDL
jgi:hypothetical protein